MAIMSEPPALAAALANHGLTVTARGTTIRVSAHVGTGADTLRLLGDAFADAAASGRVIAAEYAREGLIVEPDVSEVFTIELVDEVVQGDGDTTHEVEAATPHDSDEIVIAVVDEN